MIEKVTIEQYKATDGAVFDNETDAAAHQVQVDLGEALDVYFAGRSLTGRGQKVVETHIRSFFAWRFAVLGKGEV